MSLAIIAALTDIGRNKIADMSINGRSFIVDKFEIGQAGHDPANPLIAKTPDGSLTELPEKVFGPKVIIGGYRYLVNLYSPKFNCVLEKAEAVGVISSIGLIGRIIYSPVVDDPLLNTSFLFAIGNFPYTVKNNSEQKQLLVSIQF